MTSCGRQQGGISCNKIVCVDISFVRSSPKYTRSRSLQWRTDPAMALDFGVAKRGPVMCTRSLQSCSGVAPRKLAPKRQAHFMFRCLKPMPIAHFPGASRARPLSALCAFCLTRNSHTRTSSRCAVFGAIWVCKSPSSISVNVWVFPPCTGSRGCLAIIVVGVNAGGTRLFFYGYGLNVSSEAD